MAYQKVEAGEYYNRKTGLVEKKAPTSGEVVKEYKKAISKIGVYEKIGNSGNPYVCVEVTLASGAVKTALFSGYIKEMLDFLESVK